MRDIIWCKRCVTPNSRPRITFDSEGICNACRNSEAKASIDWQRRREEFMDYVARFKGAGPYDCVVPWSGGKDSSAIAHKLKFEFGLNPLLVTASPLIPNDIAIHNRAEMLKLGFDSVLVEPDRKVARHLARRFLIERGNPKVHWEAAKEAIPVQVALKYKIPLVFYAEHGESEYGGRVLTSESIKIKDFTEVLEHLVGDDAKNWEDEVATERTLAAYTYPEPHELQAVGVKALYFAYFFRWSMYENYLYLKDRIDFQIAPGGRTDGTFTGFDSLDDKIDTLFYYLQYVKFGFGRAARDASRMIQNGHLTRAEGLDYVRRYDHEFPHTYYAEQLEYLGLSDREMREIVDLHRNEEIWEGGDGQWALRHPAR
jgi:N-acetyl sugar amidotransferase